MITHDNVVNFIKNSLKTYFQTTQEARFSDFADNLNVYAEDSYNPNDDINVTVQFIPGTTQLGFTDMPINLIFEVIEGKATNDKTVANQVMDLVNSFVEDYNDTQVSMTDDNDETYVVNQYYSTAHVMSNGQTRGTLKYKTFNVEMRLIIYKNGYYQTLQDNAITIDNATLVNTLNIDTTIQHGQYGYTSGTSPLEKVKLTGIKYVLNISYIATKTNTLHITLANNALSLHSYAVVHTGFVTRSKTMRVLQYTEAQPYADVMKVNLSLIAEG